MKDKVVELWINLCKPSFRPWEILSTYSVRTKNKQERHQHADADTVWVGCATAE